MSPDGPQGSHGGPGRAGRARVLIAAGSDSGGGAGIQTDIKTVTALGAHAATAVTALTAQNTLGVQGVMPVPAEFVALQMRSVLDDIGADAIKTGMLGDAGLIETVASVLRTLDAVPIVVDPVMVAKGGHPLLPPDAIGALRGALLPLATLVTPNIPEAELLCGRRIATLQDMREAAVTLRAGGLGNVLLKGGHLEGDALVDLLLTDEGLTEMGDARIDTRHTHGTGCTLASAIAAGLAQGMGLVDAVRRGRAYVRAAILAAPGLGRGHGPLGHPAAA